MTADLVTPTHCPACSAATHPGDQFCEDCGADLVPGDQPTISPTGADPDGAPVSARTQLLAPPGSAAAPVAPPGSAAALVAPPGAAGSASEAPTETLSRLVCPQCGGRFAEDGYCEQCGTPAPRERDHWVETPSDWVAAVCDRGLRHQANEDAVAVAADLEPGGFAALVVCDGVSTAIASDVASLAAARAARDVLISDRPTGSDRAKAWQQRMSAAGRAANQAAAATPPIGPGPEPGATSPPSCTFVAAVVDGPNALIGCVGDSRAYWLPDHQQSASEQLSVDDSWATAQIELGMSREQAEAAPHAHAITRWLGVDSPDFEPRTRELALDTQGWLLVCSDGLWNYCSEAAQLHRLVAETISTVGDTPQAIAGALVDWANRQGGNDNITVALARIGPAAVAEPPQMTGAGSAGTPDE